MSDQNTQEEQKAPLQEEGLNANTANPEEVLTGENAGEVAPAVEKNYDGEETTQEETEEGEEEEAETESRENQE